MFTALFTPWVPWLQSATCLQSPNSLGIFLFCPFDAKEVISRWKILVFSLQSHRTPTEKQTSGDTNILVLRLHPSTLSKPKPTENKSLFKSETLQAQSYYEKPSAAGQMGDFTNCLQVLAQQLSACLEIKIPFTHAPNYCQVSSLPSQCHSPR